jgi:hypothetical protein
VFRGEPGRITALRFKWVQTEVHYDLEAGVYLKFYQKNVLGAIFSHLLANNDQFTPYLAIRGSQRAKIRRQNEHNWQNIGR